MKNINNMSFYKFEVSFYPQLTYLQIRLSRYPEGPEIWGAIAWQYITWSLNEYSETPSDLNIQNAKNWLNAMFWIWNSYEIRKKYRDYLLTQNLDDVTSSQTNMYIFFNYLKDYVITELQNTL